jgi:hypothetical protein
VHHCGTIKSALILLMHGTNLKIITINDVSGDVWLGSLTKGKWRFYLTWASAFAGSQVYSGVDLEFKYASSAF